MIRRIRVATAALICCGTANSAILGQEPPTPILPRTAEVASTSRGVVPGRVNLDTLATSIGPKAVAKVDGTAAPGLKVTLDGAASAGGKVWYRWFQTQGPKITLIGADQASAHFVVPDDVADLGFVLVVGNSSGIDARAVVIEVEDPERDPSDLPLKADAGADQTAIVGRRVTLDGSKSEPKGRVRYRWVQSSGPKASIHGSGGPTCSFIPNAPGTYQFALLVVDETGLVSEASLVQIQARIAQRDAGSTADDRPAMAIDELARASLASIPGGASYAGELSRNFDQVAERMNSFKTYNDASGELTKRIDSVVPRDPTHRSEWTDRFFKPWSDQVAAAMKDQGIDLSQPSGQTKPLSKAQRATLAEQLRFTAAGLRAGTTLR